VEDPVIKNYAATIAIIRNLTSLTKIQRGLLLGRRDLLVRAKVYIKLLIGILAWYY
jgi:hypothetical protein